MMAIPLKSLKHRHFAASPPAKVDSKRSQSLQIRSHPWPDPLIFKCSHGWLHPTSLVSCRSRPRPRAQSSGHCCSALSELSYPGRLVSESPRVPVLALVLILALVLLLASRFSLSVLGSLLPSLRAASPRSEERRVGKE